MSSNGGYTAPFPLGIGVPGQVGFTSLLQRGMPSQVGAGGWILLRVGVPRAVSGVRRLAKTEAQGRTWREWDTIPTDGLKARLHQEDQDLLAFIVAITKAGILE